MGIPLPHGPNFACPATCDHAPNPHVHVKVCRFASRPSCREVVLWATVGGHVCDVGSSGNGAPEQGRIANPPSPCRDRCPPCRSALGRVELVGMGCYDSARTVGNRNTPRPPRVMSIRCLFPHSHMQIKPKSPGARLRAIKDPTRNAGRGAIHRL